MSVEEKIGYGEHLFLLLGVTINQNKNIEHEFLDELKKEFPQYFNKDIEEIKKKQIDEEAFMNNKEEVDNSSTTSKKLYKRLSLVLHPDKNINKSEQEQNKIKETFININKYCKENDIAILLSLCKVYGVVPNLNEEDIENLDKNIECLHNKLQNEYIKVHRLWYMSKTKDKKDFFKMKFLKANNMAT